MAVRAAWRLLLTAHLAIAAAACSTESPAPAAPPPAEIRTLGFRWDEVRLWRGRESPGADWATLAYDDSAWEIQYVWMGYGVEGDAITTSLADMPGQYRTVYVRRTLELGPVARTYRRLRFSTATAGGWALYLNGVEIAREALAPDARHDTPALGDGPDTVELDVPEGLLREGANVIALEAHLTDPPPGSFLVLGEIQAIADWVYRPPFITRGPYLQRAIGDEITVVFQTSRAVGSRLRYGRPGEPVRRWRHPAATHHVYHLSALAPSAHYRWHVEIDGAGEVGAGSFTTAPGADDPFTFFVYGDTRSASTVHRRLVEQMVAETADFVIHVGDFVWLGGSDAQWDGYFGVAAPLLQRVPLFPTLGNHEFWIDGAASRYHRLFDVPENGPADQSKSAYAYTYGNARFIMLNSSAEGFVFDWGTQPDWLRRELQAAARDPRIRHVFLSMHVPLVSSGPLGPAPEAERMLSVVREIAGGPRLGPGKHGVSLMLQGHEHYYERGELEDGLRYITTGGGGGTLTPVPKKPLATSAKLVSEFHYLTISVNGPDVRVRTRRPDGTVLDEFRFSE